MRNLYQLPSHLSFEEAAAIPTTFLTAWHMLATCARIQPGEDVLVMAAGSGVGSAAIQIARRLGARVLATAGTDEVATSSANWWSCQTWAQPGTTFHPLGQTQHTQADNAIPGSPLPAATRGTR